MREARVAGVDIGTNSVRMLIAGAMRTPGRVELATIHRLMNITRLGQGVDEAGCLDGSAVARTVAVLREYRDLMREEKVERWRVAATSAVRDAADSRDFIRLVSTIMGTEPSVLSGDEEARLSFLGATHDLGRTLSRGDVVLVADIGGGSTEIIVGRDGEILEETSVDVGCVRMSERFLSSDPPRREELLEMERYISSALAPCLECISHWSPRLMVGLAGTVTTLAGLSRGLETYDGDAIHHSWLSREEVSAQYERLCGLSLGGRKEFMRLEPGRADVIIGGAAVLLVMLRELGRERLLVSEKDILDGLAISAVAEAEAGG